MNHCEFHRQWFNGCLTVAHYLIVNIKDKFYLNFILYIAFVQFNIEASGGRKTIWPSDRRQKFVTLTNQSIPIYYVYKHYLF